MLKYKSLINICIAIFLSILLFLSSGCLVIWSDDVFVGTLLKNVDAGDIEMIAEPNYLQMGSSTLKSTNDKITVATPAVIVSTEVVNEI
jgi:hypothetical protein